MNAREAIDALRSTAGCRPCQSLAVVIAQHVGDLRGLAHKAAHDRNRRSPEFWTEKIDRIRAELDRNLIDAASHLSTPHEERAPKPPRKLAVVKPAAPKPEPRLRLRLVDLPPVDLDHGSANRLPATGRCHECDRQVSGQRRYCGPCLARRSA